MSPYGLLFDSHFPYGINIWFLLENKEVPPEELR